MAIGWFIARYKIRPNRSRQRYVAMDDYTQLIAADGGTWTESEVLGNRAIVKVRALEVTLAVVEQDPDITRLPLRNLNESLGTLSARQRQELEDELLDMGYSLAEVSNGLGDTRQKTLEDFLVFAASRRFRPRYDRATDTIILDGPQEPTRPIWDVDTQVR